MVPGLGDRVVGASFCPIDGHASPLYLLRALHQDAQANGAAYKPGCKMDAIEAAPNDFTVRSSSERFTAPRVVIAAGLGSRDLAPMVGLSMPVTPLQGQIIVTERLATFPQLRHPRRPPDRGRHRHVGRQPGGRIFRHRNQGLHLKRDRRPQRPGLPCPPRCQHRPLLGRVTCYIARRISHLRAVRALPRRIRRHLPQRCDLVGAHALALAPAILEGALPEELSAFHSQRFG